MRTKLHSTTLQDTGIQHLASACRALRVFDFTFCNRATYSSVVSVRDLCPEIVLVRRQPEEFDGKFECPWGEEHSYYADGSFEFTRSVESIGWVCYLQEHQDVENQGTFFSDRLRSATILPPTTTTPTLP